MQGDQTEFVTDISKGINIVINTDITLRKTAASAERTATLQVTNEKQFNMKMVELQQLE